MTITRNRSLVPASVAASEKQLSIPSASLERDRWENEGGAVAAVQNDTPSDNGVVISWLQYAAKRVHQKKVKPDYDMIAYARRLKLASNVTQFNGRVA
jgi:hypothetical protein